MLRHIAALIVLSLCLPVATIGDVIHVPGDQPTIQAGINAAVDGDTVLVADGTYTGLGNRDIDFSGKAITVKSENGAESCIIDCEGSFLEPHRGFHFHSGENADSALQGFTIKNGIGDPNGGAILCVDNSSPMIIDNLITGCAAVNMGGAIYCPGSTPTIMENTISACSASFAGGGIACEESSPEITGNTITGCTTPHSGGAIYCSESDSTIQDNSISGNSAPYGAGIYCGAFSSPLISDNIISMNEAIETFDWAYGGGICCFEASSPTIIGNLIEENYVSGDIAGRGHGAGIYCYSSVPLISGNIITRNNTPGYGSGIAISNCSSITISDNVISYNTASHGAGIECSSDNSNVTIVNNAIIGNSSAAGSGAAIYSEKSSLQIINSTIAENMATQYGGGILCINESNITVENTILWGNTAYLAHEIFVGGAPAGQPSSLSISYSDVDPAPGVVYVMSASTLTIGDGMIYDDPRFVAGPEACLYLGHLATGQPVDSPCLDAGSSPAEDVCFAGPVGTACLDQRTTRIDHENDSGAVDLGYHHGNNLSVSCPETVSASLYCVPVSGTVPFSTVATISLTNNYTETCRRLAARIDVQTAGGPLISGLTSGSIIMGPESTQVRQFTQCIPAHPLLIGTSTIILHCEDTTLAPFNQPPYPPSGDTATATWSIIGIEGIEDPSAISAGISCVPAAGTLPFTSEVSLQLRNHSLSTRRFAYRVERVLADGTHDPEYRVGWEDLDAFEVITDYWDEFLPAQSCVTGMNRFWLSAVDVTPAPYNQPPYPPSGDTSGDGAVVLGLVTVEETTWYVDDDAPGDPGPGNPGVSDPWENGSADHPFDAIQEAIDVSFSGDTILVAGGEYSGNGNRDLNMGGRAISLISLSGAEECIIDCQGSGHRGFIFSSGEDESSLVQGFTIRNGHVAYGGGIYCLQSSPTLEQNVITGNTSQADGGGIYCEFAAPSIMNNTISGNMSFNAGGGIACRDAEPTITGNTITSNTVSSFYGYGGGLYCENSSPSITYNSVSDNRALGDHGRGGAILLKDSSPTIANNDITGNYSDRGDGGIYCLGSSPLVSGNNISQNEGSGMQSEGGLPTITGNVFSGNDGGGLYVNNSSAIVTNNVFIGNTSESGGAGIKCSGDDEPIIEKNIISGNVVLGDDTESGGGIYSGSESHAQISSNVITDNMAPKGGGIANGSCYSMMINNVISGNTAYGVGGGGISCWSGFSFPTTMMIINNTITGNTATEKGGGLYNSNTDVTIIGSILWNNNAPTGKEMYIGYEWNPTSVSISFSDVQGGQASVYVEPGCTLNWGPGMIDIDPLFVAGPLGDCYLSTIAAGQAENSPCLDTGSDLAENICFDSTEGEVCLDELTTRTDQVTDAGQADMGYHYDPDETD